MPIVIIQSAVGLLGALVIFTSGLMNFIQPPQDQLIYKETDNTMYFYLTETTTKIDKNNGNVKISYKDKHKDIEFNVEYSGEIAPEDRTQIKEIFGELHERVKRNKTWSEKVRENIKTKLRVIIDKI